MSSVTHSARCEGIAERLAEAKKTDSTGMKTPGLHRTDSEMDMLAEKAALLGQDVNATGDDTEDRPRLTSDQPLSPSEERNPSVSIVTPGENQVSDPLGSPYPMRDGMSEKARGKMRAVDPVNSNPDQEGEMVDVPDEELMKVAAAGVGPAGYIPTQEWVSSWQKGYVPSFPLLSSYQARLIPRLPLDPVLVAISELLPKIQDTQRPSGAPSSKVFNLLKEISLSEVLPPALPIQPRRFQWSTQSGIWLTSLLWGDIYVAGLTSVGVWRDTVVRLFGVKQAPLTGRTAQVGRVLKRFGVL